MRFKTILFVFIFLSVQTLANSEFKAQFEELSKSVKEAEPVRKEIAELKSKLYLAETSLKKAENLAITFEAARNMIENARAKVPCDFSTEFQRAEDITGLYVTVNYSSTSLPAKKYKGYIQQPVISLVDRSNPESGMVLSSTYNGRSIIFVFNSVGDIIKADINHVKCSGTSSDTQ